MGGRPANTPEVIWSKVDKRGPDECWPWKGWKSGGKRNKSPYGRIEIDDKSYYAHRIIYWLSFSGEIELNAPKDSSESRFVLHKCDNPICCNPNHLFLGNHQDNMIDKVQKGRSNIWKSSVESPNAKLTEDDVRWIRFIHRQGFATIKAQALLYDVSRSVISHLLYGLSYQDIL